MNDFGASPRNEAEFIYCRIREDSVRVISESAKRLGAEKPGEKRILVAHPIGYRMHSHNACALCEVKTVLRGMKGGRFSGIRELA